MPSLATLIVLVVPVVCLLITTTSIYHGGDFIELLLAHPVGRRPLFAGLYLGVTLPLAVAFLVGLLAPLIAAGAFPEHLRAIGLLATAGTLLTAVSTSIGFWVAIRMEDPAKGSGVALLIWLTLAVLYDGAVLFVAYRWAAYPLETVMLALMGVLLAVALDASAMLGYTGSVFQDFFGGWSGIAVAVLCLGAWIVIPGAAALRSFRSKDF